MEADALVVSTLRTCHVRVGKSRVVPEVGRDSDLFPAEYVLLAGIRSTTGRVDSLCHSQQIIPVYQLVVYYIVIVADAACIDHYAASLVCLWVEQIVAFLAEVQGRLRVVQICDVRSNK